MCRFLNHDVIYDYDAGLQGFNLFSYCGNNPICRIDISGTDSADLVDGDKDEEFSIEGGPTRSGNPTGGDSVPNLGNSIGGNSGGNGCSGGKFSSGCGGGAGSESTGLQTYYPPNGGFNSAPQEATLPVGTGLQRIGSLNGRYVAPAGTPPETLSLPYNQIDGSVTYLVVAKPIVVLAGNAAPWFGQIGGGTQYLLLSGNVASLIESAHLVVV